MPSNVFVSLHDSICGLGIFLCSQIIIIIMCTARRPRNPWLSKDLGLMCSRSIMSRILLRTIILIHSASFLLVYIFCHWSVQSSQCSTNLLFSLYNRRMMSTILNLADKFNNNITINLISEPILVVPDMYLNSILYLLFVLPQNPMGDCLFFVLVRRTNCRSFTYTNSNVTRQWAIWVIQYVKPRIHHDVITHIISQRV